MASSFERRAVSCLYCMQSETLEYKQVSSMRRRWAISSAAERHLLVSQKEKLHYDSSNLFRSSDLGVMSPARFHCAMLLMLMWPFCHQVPPLAQFAAYTDCSDSSQGFKLLSAHQDFDECERAIIAM